jgi:hypothetical protein
MFPPRAPWTLAALLVLLLLGVAPSAGLAASPAPTSSSVVSSLESVVPDAFPSTAPTPAVTEHNTWCDDPGAAHESYCRSLDPALGDSGWCGLFGVQPERCYHAGSARVVLQGGVRRAIPIALRVGERHDPDLGGEVFLQYGGHGDASVEVGLPSQPGESTTSPDGQHHETGEPYLSWSVSGIGSAEGKGCTVRYEADAMGILTGTVRCPSERTSRGRRLKVEVQFRAVPLVAGPLPSPTPIATPRPTAPPDPVCGLLDGAAIEAATGLEPGSLLLLAAGPGQCAGIGGDQEVAFVALREDATAPELGDGTAYRGATCTPLALEVEAGPAVGADCAWPDGRTFTVGSALVGDRSLTISIATDAEAGADRLAVTRALLETAASRLP